MGRLVALFAPCQVSAEREQGILRLFVNTGGDYGPAPGSTPTVAACYLYG
jgi:hypothetical protein